jgi:hypothetical protein
VSRSLIAVYAIVFVCAAAATFAVLARPWAATAGEEPTVQTTLRPGRFLISVTNGAQRLEIAQVLVNEAFVGFRATPTSLSPRQSIRLVVPYPWIKGETYELGLLTSTGKILEQEIENAGVG